MIKFSFSKTLLAITIASLTITSNQVNAFNYYEGDWQTLPDESAFSIGTEYLVKEVRSFNVNPYNNYLNSARRNGQQWVNHPISAAVQLTKASLNGEYLGGRYQEIETVISDFEGSMLDNIKVEVANTGLADDSVFGERYVIWFSTDENNQLVVRKILWAMLCSRPGQDFYAANSCP